MTSDGTNAMMGGDMTLSGIFSGTTESLKGFNSTSSKYTRFSKITLSASHTITGDCYGYTYVRPYSRRCLFLIKY